MIARELGYSATNLYKYFKNKDDLINEMITRRMHAHALYVASIDTSGLSSIEALKKGFKGHIHYILEIPEHYKAVMLSQDKRLLKKTQMLNKETLERLPAQAQLINQIKRGIELKEIDTKDPLMTAQVIWASMFGLLMRFITENIHDRDKIDDLVDHYFELLFSGLRHKEGNNHV